MSSDRAATIVGVGATDFSKDSGRTELRLAVEAVKAALDDCGLAPALVDGMVTSTYDNNDEIAVARALGIGDLTYFPRAPHGGGGACATVQLAALAIEAGIAEVVVCYRALNERSAYRFGQPTTLADTAPPTTANVIESWYSPFGLSTAAGTFAMLARRYMERCGATTEDFGRVSVTCRAHAATNPAAYFHERPITLEDHRRSRWIAEPLRLLDCCQESDGAVALVVTSAARARDLPHVPVAVRAAASGAARGQELVTEFYDDDEPWLPEIGVVGRQLWKRSGLRPQDIDVAVMYDHFTPAVLMQLETLGFCGPGEAPAFVREGNLGLDGALPLNPHGGQLGEAYIHGMNGVAEGVRQLRGTAVNQVADARHALVTAGTSVPTSGLVLAREEER